ncbi:MAG: Ig-like domain-containing protein [Alphaproteobacteria bacterium]
MNAGKWTYAVVMMLFLCLLVTLSCGGGDDEDRLAADDDVDFDDDVHPGDGGDDDAVDDNEPPHVMSTYPLDGWVDLKLDTYMRVTFSEEMDRESVELSFHVVDNTGGEVGGDYSWDATGMVITFTPASVLLEDSLHTVTVLTGASDLAGNRLETQYKFSFYTINLWTRTYNGPAGEFDAGRGVAVDLDGNIVIVGYQEVIGEGANIWVSKCDADGEGLWVAEYDGEESKDDFAYGVAIDDNRNVYVIGREAVAGDSSDILLLKYDDEGLLFKTYMIDGPAGGDDEGMAVATYGYESRFAVAGYVTMESGDKDAWVQQRNVYGEELWTLFVDGGSALDDAALGVAMDGNRNVYATGYETSFGEGKNIWVRVFDQEGELLWHDDYDGIVGGDDIGYAIAVNEEGEVFVTGSTTGSGPDVDIWLRKYNAEGDVVWTELIGGLAGLSDQGHGIAMWESGVYLAGTMNELSGESSDIWTASYTANGDSLWWESHGGNAHLADNGFGVALDELGCVYVVGYEVVYGESSNIWLRRYDPDGYWSND